MYYSNLDVSSTFALAGGILVVQASPQQEIANLNTATDEPALLRFDTFNEFASRAATSQEPSCRIVNDVLICAIFNDLNFYSCIDETRLSLSATAPPGLVGCKIVTLDVLATDGSEYDAPDCVNTPSTGQTSTLPSNTPISITETSSPVSTATAMSDCVSTPQDHFILQAADSGTAIDGQYGGVSRDRAGDSVFSFGIEAADSAFEFWLDPDTSALFTKQGNIGTRTAYVYIAQDSYVVFDTVNEEGIAEENDYEPREVTCNAAVGFLDCRRGDMLADFFICDDSPEVLLSITTPDGDCHPLTINVISNTCESSPAGSVTSNLPSVTLPPVLTSTSATLTSAVISATSGPIAQRQFHLQVIGSDTPDSTYVHLYNQGGDDYLAFTTDTSRASFFTLDDIGHLTTNSGTQGTTEYANVYSPTTNTALAFDMPALINNAATDESVCMLVIGNRLQCTTSANQIFYSCPDRSINVVYTGPDDSVPDDCEQISLVVEYTD